MITKNLGRTIGFIRLFGWGFHWKDEQVHSLSFSECNGYRKPLFKLGPYRVTFLRRDRH